MLKFQNKNRSMEHGPINAVINKNNIDKLKKERRSSHEIIGNNSYRNKDIITNTLPFQHKKEIFQANVDSMEGINLHNSPGYNRMDSECSIQSLPTSHYTHLRNQFNHSFESDSQKSIKINQSKIPTTNRNNRRWDINNKPYFNTFEKSDINNSRNRNSMYTLVSNNYHSNYNIKPSDNLEADAANQWKKVFLNMSTQTESFENVVLEFLETPDGEHLSLKRTDFKNNKDISLSRLEDQEIPENIQGYQNKMSTSSTENSNQEEIINSKTNIPIYHTKSVSPKGEVVNSELQSKFISTDAMNLTTILKVNNSLSSNAKIVRIPDEQYNPVSHLPIRPNSTKFKGLSIFSPHKSLGNDTENITLSLREIDENKQDSNNISNAPFNREVSHEVEEKLSDTLKKGDPKGKLYNGVPVEVISDRPKKNFNKPIDSPDQMKKKNQLKKPLVATSSTPSNFIYEPKKLPLSTKIPSPPKAPPPRSLSMQPNIVKEPMAKPRHVMSKWSGTTNNNGEHRNNLLEEIRNARSDTNFYIVETPETTEKEEEKQRPTSSPPSTVTRLMSSPLVVVPEAPKRMSKKNKKTQDNETYDKKKDVNNEKDKKTNEGKQDNKQKNNDKQQENKKKSLRKKFFSTKQTKAEKKKEANPNIIRKHSSTPNLYELTSETIEIHLEDSCKLPPPDYD